MLNRYFQKTLYKGFAMQRALQSCTTMNVQKEAQLFRFNKMTFFDYDNKDKNLFSDSSDDEHRNTRASRFSDNDDDFFGSDRPRSDVHEGKFEVSDIPLYISKMRNEIKQIKTNSRKRRDDREEIKSFFPKFNRFTAMHHQNKDRIHAEFPR